MKKEIIFAKPLFLLKMYLYQTKLYILAILFISLVQAKAQDIDTTNLVPNPSFEDYHSLPKEMGSIYFQSIPHWTANPKPCTPDYFHAKGGKGFGVPQNKCGFMYAKSGQAYAGLLVRAGKNKIDKRDIYYREHLMVKLKRPLREKYRYVVQMYIALASYSNYASAQLGFYFQRFPEQIEWDKKYLPRVTTPKDKFYDQPNQWVLVRDTIVALGGEEYLMIGDFNDYKTRQIKKITPSTKHFYQFNYQRAYYYIDDVSVVELDKFDINTIPRITITERRHPPNKLEMKTNFGKLEKGKPIVLNNIFFEFAKARLLPESFSELDKLVTLLKKYPQIKIRIMGHTDNVGTQERNQRLSEQRARSVVNYLRKNGIKVKRLEFKGYGEVHPIDSNQTKVGRQKNRRVEFVIL
ncbi:hypothetical protein BKI52_10585 [marine bacterium AO1-C]|nr:hypothetical protein BKI52_10585 [marine bacterium AO1-C]